MTNIITYFRLRPMSRTFRLSLLLIGINIFFLGELAYAQSRQATGQVKDQKGENRELALKVSPQWQEDTGDSLCQNT
ncbi:hypothetical protein G5B00_15555 [Parapedobacter sp. SGR-10]|uniref:hypothetical protein n=1 Tax=Parapedobacter sp. SGR-10 TaxID=2710879 RepID=UPI0013D19836|nr:hypothetical protein [Parapedobacter sp. SGR-10]NGF57935.1 hypothetical protein [Parapedobacter sp. SGR-10]